MINLILMKFSILINHSSHTYTDILFVGSTFYPFFDAYISETKPVLFGLWHERSGNSQWTYCYAPCTACNQILVCIITRRRFNIKKDKHNIHLILNNEMSDLWFSDWTFPDCQSLLFLPVEYPFSVSWV